MNVLKCGSGSCALDLFIDVESRKYFQCLYQNWLLDSCALWRSISCLQQIFQWTVDVGKIQRFQFILYVEFWVKTMSTVLWYSKILNYLREWAVLVFQITCKLYAAYHMLSSNVIVLLRLNFCRGHRSSPEFNMILAI